MNSKIFSGLFVLAIMAIGCVSEFTATLPSNDLEILVIDGSIIENTNATFYLSKSIPLNFPGIPEESLNINVNLFIIGSNGYKSQQATNMGRGAYSIFTGELDDNVEYGIQIEYNGDVYQSTLSKPLRTPEIDSISWVQPQEEGDVFFRVSTHDDSGEVRFFLWSYTEDWEFTAYYQVSFFFNPGNGEFYSTDYAPYFYCWKNSASRNFLIGSTESLSEDRIINKQLFSQNSGNDRFSLLYSVNVKQQAISKAAFEYYQNKIVLNDEMGGLFTPQPSELTGNITCITNPSKKAMGYIEAVRNTTQKRIFVSRSQLTRPRIFSTCTEITNDSIFILLSGFGGTIFDAYNMGFRPLEPDLMTGKPISWSTATCTECTANGGSKRKPDFWPNNHE